MEVVNPESNPVAEEVQVPDKNLSVSDSENIGAPEKEAVIAETQPSTENESVTVKTGEEFNYIRRNLYTSEIFKIELRNLPKYYGFGDLKKLLVNKLKLKLRKIKAPGHKSSRWTYICFDSKEEQLKAVELLNNFSWKNSLLQAFIANPAPDPLMKRKHEDQSESTVKRVKISTVDEMEESVKRATIPWHDVPYAEQLNRKTEDVKTILHKFSWDVVNVNPSAKKLIKEVKDENSGLPCKFFPCKGLPDKCNGYRNKCEFTIGFHAITGEKTVGFRLGSYASGSVEVAPVTAKLLHINERMVQAVECFQVFIRNSDVECYSPSTNQGVWGTLTLKTGLESQLMLIVGVHEINTSDELATKIKADLKEYFETGEGKSLDATSLYLQMITRRRSGADIPAPELLLGEVSIQQTLCGLYFRISPLSFFQVNVPCMEVMMETIKEMAKVDTNTTILDVCCGTGTLGLCFAQSCSDVIGVEKEPQAIEDAKKNAAENSITNCSFFCGSADVILPSAVRHAKTKNIVALLDPPRAGLHKRAVRVIRRVETIKKIIYLSCDARLAYSNFLDLCKAETKTMEGPPFHLKSVVPADLFPYTDRYELILYFEREESDSS